jgi:pyruvate formate lyase activating enzyme
VTVFDLERYATEDGPGIRTVVFMKGCNLRCIWCQNPESHAMQPQVMYYRERCVACGRCVGACPVAAVRRDSRYGFVTDDAACTRCGRCVSACFSDARRMVGSTYTPEEVLEVVLRDRRFYEESGGGVTFSGGEPLLQPRELREAARLCKAEGVHTAVETAGHVPWRTFEETLPYIDLLYCDLKTADTETHKHFTGVGNQRIKENITRLAKADVELIVRVPVIPGVNDSDDSFRSMYGFLQAQGGVEHVELLPFHRLGTAKYVGLGRPYPMKGVESLTPEQCEPFARIGRDMGLSVRVDGTG